MVTIIPISQYDAARQQAFLEDQAARGRFLRSYQGLFAWFDRGEPKAVRYRLEPLRQKEAIPDLERRRVYAAMGWDYVTTISDVFHVWRCDDPAAPELDTDPEVRAEGYSRLLSLLRRGQYGVAGLFLLIIALVVWANAHNPGGWLPDQINSWQPWYIGLPIVTACLFFSFDLFWWYWMVCRLVRTLKAGIPAAQRAPYQLSRCLTAAAIVVFAAYLLAMAANLLQPDSIPFCTEAELGKPVPHVAIADVGEPIAIDWKNWRTREQWWVIQETGDTRAQSRYYDVRFGLTAELLERQLREEEHMVALSEHSWLGERENGLQTLLVRDGNRLLAVYYTGGEELKDYEGDYLALLQTWQRGGT